jgi:putative redox protein
MANELCATMVLANEKVRFRAAVEGQDPISVDYVPPLGDGQGYTSLELLLISMGSCLGTGIKAIVEGRMKKPIRALSVRASGTICPVLDMVKGNTELAISYELTGWSQAASRSQPGSKRVA